jgi:hypothetical protein
MDRQLDALERHFAVHPWILGRRPSLADFALAGPLCGHLRYDLASSERWMKPRPNLYDWSERLWSGVPEASGPWVADDAVPATLLPLLTTAMREMTPYLDATASLIRGMSNGPGGHLPRIVGSVTVPYADAMLTRLGVPYTLWMAQRVRDALDEMPPSVADDARAWVRSIGGQGFLDLRLPRLRRVDVHAALA